MEFFLLIYLNSNLFKKKLSKNNIYKINKYLCLFVRFVNNLIIYTNLKQINNDNNNNKTYKTVKFGVEEKKSVRGPEIKLYLVDL